jgi:hypothetical protein
MLQVEEDRLSFPKQLFEQEYEAKFTEGVSGVFGDFKKLLVINEWSEPTFDGVYFHGIDVAGVGEDSTVLTIMNQAGKVQLIYECESPDLVEQANEIEPLLKKFNNCVGYTEKNGIGQGLADILKARGCKTTYWNTSNQSKQNLVTETIVNINKNELKLPTDKLCPRLENEMSTFVGKRTSTGLITYAAEKGLHDDYVFSLLFANRARKKLGSGLQIHEPDDEAELIENNMAEYPQSLLEMKHKMASWADSLRYD